MKIYNLFTTKQLKWMYKAFKTNIAYKGQDLSSCYITKIDINNKRYKVPVDTVKIGLLKENIKWKKHDFTEDGRTIPDRDLTNKQICVLNAMVLDPEWQEYVSSQASADFFHEKKLEIEKDIKDLFAKETIIANKIDGPNKVKFHRNWFQEKFAWARFKENRFFKNAGIEFRAISNQIKNARTIIGRIDDEISSIDLRAKEFESAHKQEVKELFPNNSVVRPGPGNKGIVNKDLITDEQKSNWNKTQGEKRWERREIKKVSNASSINSFVKKSISNQNEIIKDNAALNAQPQDTSAFSISKSQQLTPSLNIIGSNK